MLNLFIIGVYANLYSNRRNSSRPRPDIGAAAGTLKTTKRNAYRSNILKQKCESAAAHSNLQYTPKLAGLFN